MPDFITEGREGRRGVISPSMPTEVGLSFIFLSLISCLCRMETQEEKKIGTQKKKEPGGKKIQSSGVDMLGPLFLFRVQGLGSQIRSGLLL